MRHEEASSLSAHVATAEDIEAAVAGDPEATAFLEAYRESERERWRSLVAPFREDPFEGSPLLSGGGHARTPPGDGYGYHPRRGRGRLFAEWERRLGRFGLGRQSLNGSAPVQHVVVPAGYLPWPEGGEHEELSARHGLRWQSSCLVPVRPQEREVPRWALDDAKIRALVLHVYPRRTKTRTRRKAAKMCALIYLYWRAMLTSEGVGELLGLTVKQVTNRAHNARAIGDRLFVRGEN